MRRASTKAEESRSSLPFRNVPVRHKRGQDAIAVYHTDSGVASGVGWTGVWVSALNLENSRDEGAGGSCLG